LIVRLHVLKEREGVMVKSSTVPGRVIMRIELLPGAKDKLGASCEKRGMTQVATTSRIIEWFCAQNDLIQAVVLGLYPEDIRGQVGEMILKQMAAEKKK
jgi:hypothetical protein